MNPHAQSHARPLVLALVSHSNNNNFELTGISAMPKLTSLTITCDTGRALLSHARFTLSLALVITGASRTLP